MDREIITLCNYVKRKYVKEHDLRFTYLRFIVISSSNIKMTHTQNYKAGELIRVGIVICF